MKLRADERAALSGQAGAAVEMAMRLLVAVGRAQDAPGLIDIDAAHIDGCLYHGISGIDFAQGLADAGGKVAVPTTLNVTATDMLHPELYRGDPQVAELSKRLTDAYVSLGCAPTWTCAPYQLAMRPGLGQQIAWGESNAIVFANSVLGARTNRYGDFMDICCAITGKAPNTGLHTDEGRLATVEVIVDVPEDVVGSDLFYSLLGHSVGRLAGSRVPVLVGLDERASEDRLKALGAAAASSGAVAMFHAVGVTPEAPDLKTALGGRTAAVTYRVGVDELAAARGELTTSSGPLGAVSVGTPHVSLAELRRLTALVSGDRAQVPFYVNAGRDVYGEAKTMGLVKELEDFGVTFVTDTCTYVTPILGEVRGVVMTDSAKWAYYAPANLGVDVIVGSVTECVTSAVTGEVVRSEKWL